MSEFHSTIEIVLESTGHNPANHTISSMYSVDPWTYIFQKKLIFFYPLPLTQQILKLD